MTSHLVKKSLVFKLFLLKKNSTQLYYQIPVKLHTPESDKTRLTYTLDLLPMFSWNQIFLARQPAVSLLQI